MTGRPVSRISRRRMLAGSAAFAAVPLVGTSVRADATARSDRTADPDALLARMSLEQKVGQLFVTSVYGDTADTTDPTAVAQNRALLGVDNGADLVATYRVGGVIYFGYTGNLVDPGQIARLSNGLQQAAADAGPGVPLLISTDQEGGLVTRIGAPAAISPGNMALGATFDPALAYRMCRATGQQLKAMGITVDDAPVVDTNTNPDNAADGARAFGDRPLQTAAFGAASVLGYQSAGVAATAKHFPGLGSTSVNTDVGVAVSDQTRAEFERLDLPAFRAAVAAGSDLIMAAHIVARALDPSGAPASLSRPMVTGILRDELRYDGVVITDALNAEALSAYSNADRSVLAIRAGVDQLLMPTDLAGSLQAVLDAVGSGVITEARIDDSVRRILRLKRKLGLFGGALVDPGAVAGRVGTSAQLAVQDAVARASITVLRNHDRVLPLTAGSGRRVLITGYGVTTTLNLATAVAGHGVTATRLVTGSAPSAAAVDAAVEAAAQVDCVIDVSSNAWSSPEQRTLARRLRASGKPVIVVAVGAPYELGYDPDTETFVAAYGYQPPSMTAVADVIFGARPRGRLPVTVRTPDRSRVVAPFGSGLSY